MEVSKMTSSASRKTRSDDRNDKQIGCMSGIFQLIHKHDHGRKRLTQAGKTCPVSNTLAKPKETIRNSSAEITPAVCSSSDTEKKRKVELGTFDSLGKRATTDFRRLSCDIPRSPTLPLEMRRSNSMSWSPGAVFSSEKNSRSPGPVARLMGLEEIPAMTLPESAAEKRKKIFRALEKCDEDLRALKMIIEAIQIGESRTKRAAPTAQPVAPVVVKAVTTHVKVQASSAREERLVGNLCGRSSRRSAEFNSEQPSPVSVLDAWCYRDEISPLQQKGNECKKSKDEALNNSFFTRRTTGDFPGYSHRQNDNSIGNFLSTVKKLNCRAPFSSGKSIIENVNDVYKEWICEELWERRRMVVVLEGYIFGELIEEIVWELSNCSNSSPLPFQACRRKLCF